MLGHALKFGEDGLRVMPLKPDKTPHTSHGVKDATTEAATIRRWWKKWPDANIGIATGLGLVVLDADGEEGIKSLRSLEADLGKLPVTYRVRTGGGGLHLYFASVEAIRNSANRLGPKLDVRGEGGYVVAPPSTHESGNAYAIEQDAEWLPDLPARWTERMTGADGEGDRSNFSELISVDVVEGERNQRLAELAGHLAKWVPHLDAFDALVRKLAPDGLEAAEIDKLINSIWSREESKLTTDIQKELRRLQVRQRAQELLLERPFLPPENALLLSDFLAQPLAEEEFMVDQLLGREHNALLAAGYKTGKTTVLLNLLKSFTDHEPFLGHFETHLDAGRVVWFNYELTEEQAHRWAVDMNVRGADRAAYVGLRGVANPLASDAGREWVVDFLRRHECAVWFIDTFRASFFGESINDLADVARYTSLVDRIKFEAGVSEAIVTHHFGRKQHEAGQEHGLGSVELDAWTDMRWLLTRSAESRFLAVEGRSMGLQESALTYDEHSRALEVEVGVGRGEIKERKGEETKQATVESTEKQILNDLKKKPGSTSAELLGSGKSYARRKLILQRLLEEKKVRCQREGKALAHYLTDPE